MNIEFHYYALYYLCRSAGLPEDSASKIAVSSQMVDENLAAWEIRGGGQDQPEYSYTKLPVLG
jgi:hypothetical protein